MSKLASPKPQSYDKGMKLENATFAITVSWILTLVVVAGGNILLTIDYAMGGNFQDIVLWNWIDILLTLGFAFAIYKKSRVGAGLWLVYYLVTQLLGWLESGVAGPPVGPIILLFVFFQGFRGAVAYHQLQEKPAEITPE